MNKLFTSINNFFQMRNYFKTIRNNNIKISSYLKNSRINIKGFNNSVFIEKGNIKRLKVGITGNKNTLNIHSSSMLRNLNIIIEGENLNVLIKENCEIGSAQIVCCGKNTSIEIGKNCLLANNIEIRNCDGHAIIENNQIINYSKSIKISDDIWVCQNVKILKGVIIGCNSVIALDSLVTQGLYKPHTILAGSPAKVIKHNISWDKKRTD